MKRFAHISDLHIGRSAETNQNAAMLCSALLDHGVETVIATGDLTHRGNTAELELFEEIFARCGRMGASSWCPATTTVSATTCRGRSWAARACRPPFALEFMSCA
jgi:3',5'-cyclic AMP phosphodiesterase CpdA